jgi:protein O-mannose beta-1,4-N-acetylglucosaminyltransferase
VQENVPFKDRFRDRNLIELSSVENHSTFYWNFIEASPFYKELQNVDVRYEPDMHFIFRRLHPRNIMHNLHDDAMNLYFILKEYVGGGSNNLRMPFSLNHHLLIIDDHGATESTRPIQYLSNHPVRFRSYLTTESQNAITCFRDAVVGQSKLTAWYQYGFKYPQGF